MKKIFPVQSEYENTRLDRWFRKNIFNVPQSLLEKNIRKGNIKINNKIKKSSYKVQLGDHITIYNFSSFKNNIVGKIKKYIPTKSELKSSEDFFIENNENFAVINKPSGISVQSGTKSKRNILDILRQTKEFQGCIPYTVHRIDKETTGVLLVAKNRKYAQILTSLFRVRKINKTYLGIVIGEVQKKNDVLIDYLLYYEGKKKITVKAITRFNLLDTSSNHSLLELHPETGRKHQIRKQLLIYGHPILGDSKYKLYNKNYSKKNFLMLHAYKINFSINGTKYKFYAKPPLSFNKILKEKYLKIF